MADGEQFADPYQHMPMSEIVADNAEDCANAIFKEALVAAATSIVNMASHADSENLRFKAAQYVVERNLGTIPKGGESTDMWDKFLSDVSKSDGA
jgi:hypothetical protein